jgi:glucan phosphoethanolaminetransferase (alkaline phosphatase superfamily)
MMLLLVALFGLLVPNGLFLYWAAAEFSGWREVLHDKLALAFMIDALMAMVLLAIWFARRPVGPVSWKTFVLLSLIGGLGFSLPLYWWLNTRHNGRV